MDKFNNNQDINISTIYSCFDIEKDSVWDKVINYNFPSDDVFKDYIEDSAIRLRISKLRTQKQLLKVKVGQTENFDEKYNYLSEMKNIDDQIAKLEKDIK